MKRAFSAVLCLPVLLAFFCYSPQAKAETAPGATAGIGILPALIEKAADPGKSITEQLEVTNLSPAKQTYYLFVKDITGVDSGNRPVFATPNSEKTGFEMSDWVVLDKDQVDLDPQGTATVNVTINVPTKATPGSHFAGVFVSMNPPKMRSVGAAVAYQVASILSIQVAGDVVNKASIRQFSTGNYIYGSTNVDFHAKVQNEGNILIRPIGPLDIYNMFGKRVTSLTFNDNKSAVFPGTTREFPVVTWQSDNIGFGRYQARLSLSYGGQTSGQQSIYTTVTFWILPKNIILPALAILFFLLGTAYISVRLYVRRKLLMMSSQSHRIVRQRRRGGGISALWLTIVVMISVTAVFALILLVLFA